MSAIQADPDPLFFQVFLSSFRGNRFIHLKRTATNNIHLTCIPAVRGDRAGVDVPVASQAGGYDLLCPWNKGGEGGSAGLGTKRKCIVSIEPPP